MNPSSTPAAGGIDLPSSAWNAFLWRKAVNFWPCIRRSGGRVTHLSTDFTHAVVRLRLNWRTRNLVGTIFGGAMFASTDPMYMLMLHKIFGRTHVVWDKGCVARFKRPGRTTLFAEFRLTPEMLANVRDTVAARGEADFTWTIQYKDAAGIVHAEFDKTIYVAEKSFYKHKLGARAAASSAQAA